MNKINLNSIDFNLLKTFQVLFEERHVGRSAKRMNVSQSAMSHSLARLRETFDERLFERSVNGIVPTEKAVILAKEVAEIIDKVNGLFEDEKLEPAQLEATISIMTHDFIVMNLLTDILNKIKIAAPKVKFSIHSYKPNWHELMTNGQIDLLLASGLNTDKKFESQLFYEDALVCLLDKKNKALKNWTSSSIFEQEHIKLSLLDPKFDPVDVYAKQHGLSRKVGLYTESMQLQPTLLVDTDLIAFLPQVLAKNATEKSSLVMKECPFQLPTLPIKCIWHQKYNDNLKHRWLRQFFSLM